MLRPAIAAACRIVMLTLARTATARTRNTAQISLAALIISCLAAITAVSFPPVQEIPWLKTFCPAHFSVEELAYASIVELVKVLRVAFLLVMI